MPIGAAASVEGKLRLLLKAATEIAFPEINDEGYVIIPKDKRRELELNLETAVNLLSVFRGCSRSLSSASPSVALIPKNDLEWKRLGAAKGFLVGQSSTMSAHAQVPLEEKILLGMTDRLDGVSLMAEALSHRLESGRFREYVRIFEAAFAIQFSQTSRKLQQFLNPDFGYTRAEIDLWIEMRDPLTHADGRLSSRILFDADVRKVTQRMQQAAYDVLFNKAIWHEKSKGRRVLWIPTAGTSSASVDIFVQQGAAVTFRSQVFDEFGVFPMDLQCVLNPPPAEWWCKFAGPVENGGAVE